MDIQPQTAPHRVFRHVADAVRRRRLIRSDDRVLVAVSGGPDSVCLLLILHEMRERGLFPGLELQVAHVNYGLRGEESEGDEAYVRALAAQLGLPVHCERVRLQPKSGQTTQSSAREARYAIFARLLRERHLTAVATGHTADDQAETILMWLVRGAGTDGLSGIPVKRAGGVVRPLLEVTRRQVLDYLAFRGMPYRSDASNEKPVYRRNRIRHEVLPLLCALNPRIVEGLAREADILAADAAVLDELARAQWTAVAKEESSGRVVLDGERLAAQPVALQRRLVRRALSVMRGRSSGLTFRHVSDVLERVLEGVPGTRLNLPGGVLVERAGNVVMVGYGPRKMAGPFETVLTNGIPLAIPGEIPLGEGGRRLLAREGAGEASVRDPGRIFVVDADRLDGALTVRNWRRGDWFRPVGMGGHRKKLQDFFVDQKVRRAQRDRIPLVVAPAGIVWVVGYRGDERFAVGPATARPVTFSIAGDES